MILWKDPETGKKYKVGENDELVGRTADGKPLFKPKELSINPDLPGGGGVLGAPAEQARFGLNKNDALRQEPARTPGRTIKEGLAVGFGDDPGKIAFLKKFYQDADISEDGSLVVKDNGKWKYFNKPGASMTDLYNIPGHAVVPVSQMLGMAAGSPGGYPGMIAGGAAGSGIGEGIRQGIGLSAGTQSKPDIGSVGTETLFGGATSGLIGSPSKFARNIYNDPTRGRIAANLIGKFTNKPPEVIYQYLLRGRKAFVTELNLSDTGLLDDVAKMSNQLASIWEKQGIDEAGITKKLYELSKDIKTNYGKTLSTKGDELAKATTELGGVSEFSSQAIVAAKEKAKNAILGKYKQVFDKETIESLMKEGSVGKQIQIINEAAKKARAAKKGIQFDLVDQFKKDLQNLATYGKDTSARQSDLAKTYAEELRSGLIKKAKATGSTQGKTYIENNAILSKLHEIDKTLGGKLKLSDEFMTAEKQLLKNDKLDQGTRDALQALDDILPPEQKFMGKLSSITQDPGYLRAKDIKTSLAGMGEMTEQPITKGGKPTEKIHAIFKNKYQTGYNPKAVEYKALEEANKDIMGNTGEDILKKMEEKYIAKALYQPQGVGLTKSMVETGLLGGDKPAERGLLDILKDWSSVGNKIYNRPIAGLPLRTTGAVLTNPELSSTLGGLLLKKIMYDPKEASGYY